jgi:hypothetical protein
MGNFAEIVEKRRSVRLFDGGSVPEEVVQRCLDLAMKSASSSNLQPWEFYFCDERCMNVWLNTHMTQLINYVGIKTKPQESPIDIVQTTHQNWQGEKYTRTTIKFLSEPDVNDSIAT